MNNKKSLVYGIIALLVITLAIIGVTCVYFQNQYDSTSNEDVKVTTYTTDILTASKKIGFIYKKGNGLCHPSLVQLVVHGYSTLLVLYQVMM